MKKTLTSLLCGAMILGGAAISQAAQVDGMQTNRGADLPGSLDVFVNPAGTGDALIGGYYNARGSYNLITVVNTSQTRGIAAKVRFREGQYSNEVLDFFICLSAGDRWTAWVYGDENPSNPAQILVVDTDTPTYPDFGAPNATSFHYSSTGAKAAVNADMTKEGYFEVIGVSSWADTPGNGKIVKTDKACGQVLNLDSESGFTTPILYDVPNYLAGSVVVYDLVGGAAGYGYNMTALADFRNAVVSSASLAVDSAPVLGDSQDGWDGVNYVLTKKELMAFYDVESSLKGQSDVIVTFPTKRKTIEAGSTATQVFEGTLCQSGSTTCVDGSWTNACETIKVKLFDDQENSPTTTLGFSPSTTTQLKLCNEVNTITMGGSASSILNTTLKAFNVDTGSYQKGWMVIDFKDGGAKRYITLDGVITYGLPVLGYELSSFLDGNYGNMLPVRYTSGKGISSATGNDAGRTDNATN